MTPKQFKAGLEKLEMTQVGFARLVGSDPRTARRWATGEATMAGSAAILLQLLLAGEVTVDAIDVARTAANLRRPL